ncbi:MAG: deoxyribodipyrimidine photo-lyase [Anaerolineaceae bacterium]
MTRAADLGTPGSTALVWFRRDLRVHDHPALTAALAGFRQVACLYVLDDRLLRGQMASPNRTWFLRESVAELSAAIEARGGSLAIHHGRPESVIPAVARSIGAQAVFVSRDYSPFGRARDRRVASTLARSGTEFIEMPGVLAVEPEEIVNATGGAFSVFSAFFRRWSVIPLRTVLSPPEQIPAPAANAALSTRDLEALTAAAPPVAPVGPGESAARERLERFLADAAWRYAADRDRMDRPDTSRVSQDLRWGLLSPLEVLSRSAAVDATEFVRQVAWRDFYSHLAWYSPRVLREPYQTGFADLRWATDQTALKAWEGGRTGYPVVDAAIRQLVATGWMHNRSRMIVASFLTKHLLVDYRKGERFFMEHLLDGDVAVNNGGWQWASSTGASAQPYFRVFNPMLQGKRFDPDGSFVRSWLPELEDFPTRFIHEPWSAPPDVQVAAHCVVGRDYPAPIVPHEGAAFRARDFFGSQLRARES